MEKKEEENKFLYYLGFAVAISTLLLNVVQIRSFIKQNKENKLNNNNQIK